MNRPATALYAGAAGCYQRGMTATASRGAFRLFTWRGISVFVHWSWFLVGAIEITARSKSYASPLWNVLEYLALFLLVLLHEFGHALACRQVGGIAERILLWPLGGVAYVDPPQRPGAVLWSIAAGPLVNVALAPLILAIDVGSRASGLQAALPDVHVFLRTLFALNGGLFLFNILPVYPLDGGQILRALLWYPLGQATSLTVVSIIGALGGTALAVAALDRQSFWFGILALFILARCWGAFKEARALRVLQRAPRRADCACPACAAPPPAGDFWTCGACRARFDIFRTGGTCPACAARFEVTRCLQCGRASPIRLWAGRTLDPSGWSPS